MSPALNNRNARVHSRWEQELEDGNASLHKQSARTSQRLPRGGSEGPTPRLDTVIVMLPAHLLIPSKTPTPAPCACLQGPHPPPVRVLNFPFNKGTPGPRTIISIIF